MKDRKFLCGLFGVIFWWFCFTGFSSMAVAKQGVEQRVEELEKRVEELEKRIEHPSTRVIAIGMHLEQLIKEMRTRNAWRITLEKTRVDPNFKDDGGAPNARIAVYLNGRPIFDTLSSQYATWYESVAKDIYEVNWLSDIPVIDLNEDGRFDREEREWRDRAREGLSMEFEFGFKDELVVELWDRDTDKDNFIASRRVDDLLELVELVSGQSCVNFKVEKLEAKK